MSETTKLPLTWDIEVVRALYRERGLNYDDLGPRGFARWRTFDDVDTVGDNFVADYAALLAQRFES